MKRSPARKGNERRRKARHNKEKSTTAPSTYLSGSKGLDCCYHCSKNLSAEHERALFVEEEVGRIFCSESCIASYFTPEIDRLEREYFDRLSSNDLSQQEREGLAHLRWITLQEPDEVWREKTLNGDYRYTLVSEFMPGNKKVWCVCICLFLKGEPSFLYLAFPTRNAAMVNHYRRGERIQWERSSADAPGAGSGEEQGARRESSGEGVDPQDRIDRLADAWTEDETFLASMSRERSPDDIPVADYGLYQSCMEETLQEPDEVWGISMHSQGGLKIYHFIRHYPDEHPGVWFVIVAREVQDEEQIEIIDAFPTRDSSLVDHYRQGEQELGQREAKATARVVH